VTALDPEAILRARSEVTRPRSRILSFLTGEVSVDQGGSADPASFAPPSDEVRREMLRLQLEAERADLEAEAVALKSDVLATRGIPLSALADEAEPDAGEANAAEPAVATVAAPADVAAPPSPETADVPPAAPADASIPQRPPGT
jgi:hypothetical protein